jgi:hypothetical protein
MKIIHNAATGETLELPLTNEDLLELEEKKAREEAAELALQQALAEAAVKRQALLDKLGITEEEAKLLLG